MRKEHIGMRGAVPENLDSGSAIEVRYEAHDPLTLDDVAVGYDLDGFLAVLRADLI